MKLEIEIKKDGIIHCLGFLNYGNFRRLEMKDEFIIDLYKYSNFSYSYCAFFYKTQRIVGFREFRTKRELYSAVHFLLKEELYDVV